MTSTPCLTRQPVHSIHDLPSWAYNVVAVTVAFMCRLIALLCFIFAAFGIPSRINLIALGLALWLVTVLL